MIENSRLSVIMGGLFHCTPAWNRKWPDENFSFAQCFAFWLPSAGGVSLETQAGKFEVSPGKLYFIPGYHLLRQTCPGKMDVYWINFVSQSYFLHHRLLSIRAVHDWPTAAVPGVEQTFHRFDEFFEDLESGHSPLRKDLPAGLALQIEGALISLIGSLIEATDAEFHRGDYSGLERLKPAIDFMDRQYLRNPSLSEIGRQIRLAPDYFHRLFKRETGMTPFKYMENRRLDLARKLLFDPRLNVKEVAQQTGYGNPFYFTRAFRRRFGLAPTHFRQTP